jgi:hypothetical protein
VNRFSTEHEEAIMRRIKSIKDLPLFPVIPFLPVAIFIASLATSIRALVRVRRLERRLTETPA